jgi:hypothetical protein
VTFGVPEGPRYSPTMVHSPPVRGDLGPWRWVVTWGVLGRPGFAVEHVTAFDSDEALVRAGERRSELGRPTAAFPG